MCFTYVENASCGSETNIIEVICWAVQFLSIISSFFSWRLGVALVSLYPLFISTEWTCTRQRASALTISSSKVKHIFPRNDDKNHKEYDVEFFFFRLFYPISEMHLINYLTQKPFLEFIAFRKMTFAFNFLPEWNVSQPLYAGKISFWLASSCYTKKKWMLPLYSVNGMNGMVMKKWSGRINWVGYPRTKWKLKVKVAIIESFWRCLWSTRDVLIPEIYLIILRQSSHGNLTNLATSEGSWWEHVWFTIHISIHWFSNWRSVSCSSCIQNVFLAPGVSNFARHFQLYGIESRCKQILLPHLLLIFFRGPLRQR